MRHSSRIVMFATGLLCLSSHAAAQYNERPALVGSLDKAVDCSGRSIKNKRVRAVHTTDPSIPGGTSYLISRDPFLAYQLGRNLNFREFRSRDGVFSATISGLGGPMPDGTTAKITTNNQTSCVGCHSLPQGNPGGGPNFHKDSGFGRNSPHYYGAGIVEMLAIQVRSEIMLQIDTDQGGWISAAESQAAASSVSVVTSASDTIDYGDPRLSGGATGSPDLNNILRVWYVDAAGKPVAGAQQVDGVQTFGYNFEVIVWGWGQGPGRSALNPTNRAFYWDPAVTHGGLESYDPSTTNDPDGDGVSEPTLAGAIQFPVTHRAPDAGAIVDPLGFSRDDPDGDGHLNEISEGDLDLAEWFMLNTPRPAFSGTAKEFRKGIESMDLMGCLECHVNRWDIRPSDANFAGDRRLFDLAVSWDEADARLEGKLERLYTTVGQDNIPNRNGFTVLGLFSDLRHHDMGEGFKEIDFGGTANTIWRTAPLWGIGSSFPYGHDGQSLTLESAILRHDGEGAASKAAWLAAGAAHQNRVLTLLRNLVLYDVESLPADIDGNGQIAANFMVAGTDTGEERFNAEWLFQTPVRIQGMVSNSDGVQIRSFAATNISAAYGESLQQRVDSDDDGWPDVWDHAPGAPGYKDGVNN